MSLFQIGGFTEDDQTPTFSIEIPHALSLVATGSLDGQVQGLNELNQQYERDVRAGQLHAAGADDLLEHARDGLRRQPRRARRARRRVPALEAPARAAEVVPLDRRRHVVPAVRRDRLRAGC